MMLSFILKNSKMESGSLFSFSLSDGQQTDS